MQRILRKLLSWLSSCRTRILVSVIVILIPVFVSFFHVGSVVVDGFMSGNVPASSIDIRVGDFVYEVDGVELNNVRNYAVAINRNNPGDIVHIVTSRGVFDVLLDQDLVWGKARLGLVVKNSPYVWWFQFLVEFCAFVVAFLSVSGSISSFRGFFGVNVMNFADVASTNLFVVFGKFEGNPFALWLIEEIGFGFAVFVKVLVVLILTYFLAKRGGVWRDLCLRLVLFMLVFVVVRNVLSI